MKSRWNIQLLIILLNMFFSGIILKTKGQPPYNKSVLINIFGGTNPYQNQAWNNWNVTLNKQSGAFVYTDGSISPITAYISASSSVVDNGTKYGGIMCPPEVLRYASHYTSARTITLQHLDSTALYNITIYTSRSRTDSQNCFITIGNLTDTVNYVNNLNQPLVFPTIRPSINNEIIVTLHKGSPSSYNYINGLKLEIINPNQMQPPVASAGPDQNLVLPKNNTLLSGSYQSTQGLSALGWRQIAGPSLVLSETAITEQVPIANLLEGVYDFEFFVTDTVGQTAKDTLSLWIRQAIPGDTLDTDTLGCVTTFTIVILGSSTAAGKGAQPLDSAWANQFNVYLKSRQLQSKIINLAKLGLSTYETLCPNGFTPPAGRPLPDTQRNITAALKFHPDAIIISLPSNDVYNGYSQQEQELNYERTATILTERSIPFWVSTTQPRNVPLSLREQLMLMRDWTYSRFGLYAIDFWSDISNADGTINPVYAAGDGIHVNNAGHRVLFSRVVAKHLIDHLCVTHNTAPFLSAGADQQVMMPADSIILNAILEDTASISSLRWSQLEGPSRLIITDSSKQRSALTRFIPGTYLLQCKIINIYGKQASDTVAIYVWEDSTNMLPTAITEGTLSIQLPTDSLIAVGSGSDPDGSILYYHWEQLTGPTIAIITQADSALAPISNLIAGNYSFRLTVYDNGGGKNYDDLFITVLPLQKNSVHAGNDTILQAGTTEFLLHGFNGNEFATLSTHWLLLSGPSPIAFGTPDELFTTISNLQSGTYAISLSITNEFLVVSRDTIIITILSEHVLTKTIHVNLYGGLYPYNNAEWNNWNLNFGLISPTLHYDDGTSSGLKISLSAHSSIVDNGISYGGTVCPPAVLRYASHYPTTRKITLQNLHPASTYTIYIFSSRKSISGAQSTIYVSGASSDTVQYTNNLRDTAKLQALKPDQSGNIEINILKIGSNSYNYINGLSIIEKEGIAAAAAVMASTPITNILQSGNRKIVSFNVFPNPFMNKLMIHLQAKNQGIIEYTLFNTAGSTITSGSFTTTSANSQFSIDLESLHAGPYILQLQLNKESRFFKIIKSQ